MRPFRRYEFGPELGGSQKIAQKRIASEEFLWLPVFVQFLNGLDYHCLITFSVIKRVEHFWLPGLNPSEQKAFTFDNDFFLKCL